ncbi:MAG: hypothetical protein AAFX85_12555, partial [Pseudomonadota bacterium]
MTESRVLRVPGADALSSFRLQRLHDTLREALPSLTGVRACWWYLIEGAPLEASTSARLSSLLGAVERSEDAAAQIVVAPRIGTISPWSSKATDIVHRCGFHQVTRVERAMAWWLEGLDTLDEATLARIGDRLHDRMTESLFTSLEEADALFAHHAPARGGAVEVIEFNDTVDAQGPVVALELPQLVEPTAAGYWVTV